MITELSNLIFPLTLYNSLSFTDYEKEGKESGECKEKKQKV